MKNRTTFTNNPVHNFAKLLGVYAFLGGVILAIILGFAGYGSSGFDSEKLMIPNILEVISIVFGVLTSALILLFSLGYLFSAVIDKIYNYFGWVNIGGTMTLSQYLQNIGIVLLAPSIVLGAITAFLYSI